MAGCLLGSPVSTSGNQGLVSFTVKVEIKSPNCYLLIITVRGAVK